MIPSSDITISQFDYNGESMLPIQSSVLCKLAVPFEIPFGFNA